MLGAVIGDIIGSRFELNNISNTDFELFTAESDFTDDTVCTVAVAEWVAQGCPDSLADIMQNWCRRYPDRAYGKRFREWIYQAPPQPYGSWGNGSAMRVSAVGWAFDTLAETLDMARRSAEITHNHPEGIKGAQAVAAAIFFARQGWRKEQIIGEIMQQFGYRLPENCAAIRGKNNFNDSCQQTVPLVFAVFSESHDFIDAIRLAVSIGGDSDTLAAMVGSIAEVYYCDIPDTVCQATLSRLPEEMKQVLQFFQAA